MLLAIIAAIPCIRSAASARSAKRLDPIFEADAWIDVRLTAARAAGRVVLVDVFTFECSNCTRVTPNLQALYARYPRAQLEIVGVHTPEVPAYQARVSYVRENARRNRLPWPIALDNAYRIWNAYAVDAWPTQLVFGRSGALAGRVVGDAQDRALNEIVERAMHA